MVQSVEAQNLEERVQLLLALDDRKRHLERVLQDSEFAGRGRDPEIVRYLDIVTVLVERERNR